MNVPGTIILTGMGVLVVSSIAEGFGLSLAEKVSATPWQYAILGAASLFTIMFIGEALNARHLALPLAAFLFAGVFFIAATQIMNTSALWAFGLWLGVAGVVDIVLEKPVDSVQKLGGYGVIFLILLFLNR